MPKWSLKPLLCSVQIKRYKTKTKISDLLDDCLFLVFDLLSLEQKCGIKRVNKRWCRVVSEVIEYKENRIKFANDLPLANPMHLGNLINNDLSFLNNFNKTKINKLVLDGYWTDISKKCILGIDHFVLILGTLPRLKTLKLKCLYLSSNPNIALNKLETLGSNLVSFSAKFCQTRNDFVELALALLKSAKNLKKLKLDHVNAKLLRLIAEMRSLEVMCLCNVTVDNISYLTAHKPLKRVSFYDYRVALGDPVLNSFQHNKTLESLDLGFDKVRFEIPFLSAPIQPAIKFRYFPIKKLYLRRFAISYLDIDFLVMHLPLIEKLSFCRFKVNCLSPEHNSGELGKYCKECVQTLVRQFTRFNLKVLKLNIVYVNEDCVTMASDVSETLAEMLEDASMLESLRKLCCYDKCKKAGKLFKALCKKASETPDKQFQFLVIPENKKYLSSKAMAKSRNVVILEKLAINCEDNYFTKNDMATKPKICI